MNDIDKVCLYSLMRHTTPNSFYVGFAPIVDETIYDRSTVRVAIRRLARKGLAQYAKALTSEDGELCGAGYAITEEGLKAAEGLENDEAVKAGFK